MIRLLLFNLRRRIRYQLHEARRRLRYRAKRHRFGGFDVEVRFHYPRQRLDSYVAHVFPGHGPAEIRDAIADGRILVDMRKVGPDHRVEQYERLQILDPSFERPRIRPLDVPLSILYEDEDLVVVDKPARLLTHPNLDLGDPSVLAGLARLGKLYEPEVFHCEGPVVHRLDHGTSGCLCVAKTRRGQEAMRRLFRKRRIRKEYVALVRGRLEGKGTIDLPIGRDPENSTRRKVDLESGKRSRTHYVVEETGPTWSQVRLELETGRTHQIRVHLSAIGHPILGDSLYGGKRPGRMLLHASRLAFRHPFRGEEVDVRAPLPPEFEAARSAPGAP